MTSIPLNGPWDGAALGYDAWKTRLPGWWDPPNEPNGFDSFYCDACCDVGWLECCDSGHEMVIPCTECSSELELWDLDE